jgi:hypothetical protein
MVQFELPRSLSYDDPGLRTASLAEGDVDWYRHEFEDQEWWSVSVEPDDPSALVVRITVLDEELVEIDSSTEGVAWGYSDPSPPDAPGPVVRYLRAEAESGCGTYGFFTYVL